MLVHICAKNHMVLGGARKEGERRAHDLSRGESKRTTPEVVRRDATYFEYAVVT